MIHEIFRWLHEIAIYLLIANLVIQLIPGKHYQKYIRLFLHLLFFAVVLMPFMQQFMKMDLHNLLAQYGQELETQINHGLPQMEDEMELMNPIEGNEDGIKMEPICIEDEKFTVQPVETVEIRTDEK